MKGQNKGLLPVYSDPMVFLDSSGKVIGKLPDGYWILNTPKGEYERGWAEGMAPVSIEEGLIPAKNINTNEITLFDHTGKVRINFGTRYHSVTPNYEGFHLALKKEEQQYYTKDVYFFLDRSGKIVFSRKGYDDATIFHDGISAVRIGTNRMYIDTLGQELRIIDSTWTNIEEVTPFYHGLSCIKLGPPIACSYEKCFDYVFINMKGEVIHDTRKIFPGKKIKSVTPMMGGMSLIKIYSESITSYSNTIAFLKPNGEVLGPYDEVYTYRNTDYSYGFAPMVEMVSVRESKARKKILYLLSYEGDTIAFNSFGKYIPSTLYQLSDSFYQVSHYNTENKKTLTRIYNSKSRQYIYTPQHEVMGVKGDLVSLREPLADRFYVVNYKTGKRVYDTDASVMLWSIIDSAMVNPLLVKRFRCKDSVSLYKMNALKALEEITLLNLKVKTLPDSFYFPLLQLLRIDGLFMLESLPSHLNSLRKISLRNCPKVTNLMEMLKAQMQLEELYLINFGLTEAEELQIRTMFPSAKLVINGSKEAAHSRVYEVIDGF